MIKINLLDYRKEMVRSKVQMEIAIALGLIVLTMGILGFISSYQGKKMARLKAEITRKNQELESLSYVERKVMESEKMQKRLEDIVKTITGLKNNQKEPAKLYDEMINKRLPPNEMWLERISEGPNEVVLRGYSFRDSAISAFMESLEKMKKFSSVNLEYIKQKKIEKRKVKEFKIVCVY